MLDFTPEHIRWQGPKVVNFSPLSQKIHTNTAQDNSVGLITVRLVCTVVSYHISRLHRGFRDECIFIISMLWLFLLTVHSTANLLYVFVLYDLLSAIRDDVARDIARGL